MADKPSPMNRADTRIMGRITEYRAMPWGDRSVKLALWKRSAGPETIFFLHGLGCSKSTFQAAWEAPALASYSLFAVDLPGFGESSRSNEWSYDLEEQAALCAALIQGQGDRPVHVVGHSLGGTVAALLAEDTLRRLASLVLVEGRLLARSCNHSRVISKYREADFVQRHFPVWCRRVEQDPHLAFDLKDADPVAFYRSACSLYRWVRRGDLSGRLAARTALPKAFIHGERNRDLGECRSVPGMPAIAIPDADHFPMHDNPAEFYQALATFLHAIPREDGPV